MNKEKSDLSKTPRGGGVAGVVINELSSPPKPRPAFRVGIVGHRPNRLKHADMNKLEKVIGEILKTVQEEVFDFAEKNTDLFAGASASQSVSDSKTISDKNYAAEYGVKDLKASADSSAPESTSASAEESVSSSKLKLVPVTLRAISPLAEGTDRIFAEQALRLGWELCCVMPFHQSEFEKDFLPGAALEPDSLAGFRSLLSRAEKSGGLTVFQLDGSRSDESAAYGMGGRVLLNQSDLLIVVWDGERLGKRGGTEETMAEALQNGVPVIWIDAKAPHSWQQLLPDKPLPNDTSIRAIPDNSGNAGTLRDIVRGSLDIPKPPKSENEKKYKENPLRDLKRFYKEIRPLHNWGVLWKLFRDFLGSPSIKTPGISVAPFEQDVCKEWPADTSSPVASMVNTLRPFYAWPDKLAVIYSDRYRSAFILSFILAAAAVAIALFPMGFLVKPGSAAEIICVFMELVSICMILFFVLRGWIGAWHERWIDYRLAAELIRHLRVVAPVGGARPFVLVPAHHTVYGQPSATWMDWYVRAAARTIGLPNAVVDKIYINTSLEHLKNLLSDQLKYHRKNSQRSTTIEHRLHKGILLILFITIIACLIHLLPMIINIPVIHKYFQGYQLTFLCGVLPAFGAALASINNQGEFKRVSRRSEAMQKQLALMIGRVNMLQTKINASSPGVSFTSEVSALAGDSARLLVYEVLDWRIVFLDRPLEVGP